MPRNDKETLPQNTGDPTPNPTPRVWQNSILVGPQTAGIPITHNEEGNVVGSDDYLGIPVTNDKTGGAVSYFRSQRRK